MLVYFYRLWVCLNYELEALLGFHNLEGGEGLPWEQPPAEHRSKEHVKNRRDPAGDAEQVWASDQSFS